MSETPTDRVELTEGERAILRGVLHEFKSRTCDDDCSNDTYAAVESIVAARVQALTAERDELRERLGQIDAMGGIADLFAERDQWRKTAERYEAELAAANARCAELETGIAKLRDGMHEFMRGNWPESPTPVEVYSALAALTPEGKRGSDPFTPADLGQLEPEGRP